MEPTSQRFPSLAGIGREVAAEGRAWTRQRLQARLQPLAGQHSEVFPLRQRKRRSRSLRSEFGDVKRAVDYGQELQSRAWRCPVQRFWGMGPHPKITPGLAGREGGGELAGRTGRTGTAAKRGSFARRLGAGAPDVVLGGWRQLDLELETRSLGTGDRIAGFLSWPPTPVGVGGGLARPNPTGAIALGRAPFAPIAPRPGEKSAGPNPRTEAASRCHRRGDRTRK